MPKPIAIINVYPTMMKQGADLLDIEINHELLASLKQQGVTDLFLVTHQPLHDPVTFYQHRLLRMELEDQQFKVHAIVSPGDLIHSNTFSPNEARFICASHIDTRRFKHAQGTFLSKLRTVLPTYHNTFPKLIDFSSSKGLPDEVFNFVQRRIDFYSKKQPLSSSDYYYTYLRHHLAHLLVDERAAIHPGLVKLITDNLKKHPHTILYIDCDQTRVAQISTQLSNIKVICTHSETSVEEQLDNALTLSPIHQIDKAIVHEIARLNANRHWYFTSPDHKIGGLNWLREQLREDKHQHHHTFAGLLNEWKQRTSFKWRKDKLLTHAELMGQHRFNLFQDKDKQPSSYDFILKLEGQFGEVKLIEEKPTVASARSNFSQ